MKTLHIYESRPYTPGDFLLVGEVLTPVKAQTTFFLRDCDKVVKCVMETTLVGIMFVCSDFLANKINLIDAMHRLKNASIAIELISWEDAAKELGL